MSGGAIGPGDWIECIDASGDHGRIVREGAIYRVIDVGPSDYPGLEYIECVFIFPRHHQFPSGRRYAGSDIRRFRPIYRPKQEIIEALKAPPKRVREDA